jgi:hypothetical protein
MVTVHQVVDHQNSIYAAPYTSFPFGTNPIVVHNQPGWSTEPEETDGFLTIPLPGNAANPCAVRPRFHWSRQPVNSNATSFDNMADAAWEAPTDKPNVNAARLQCLRKCEASHYMAGADVYGGIRSNRNCDWHLPRP